MYHRKPFVINDEDHDAIMKYEHVKVDLSEECLGNVPGQSALFNDYVYSHTEYRKKLDSIEFYYLSYISVGKEYRRQGHGTKLVNQLIEKANSENIPIILEAGFTNEILYQTNRLEHNLLGWLYRNVVPFYESLGFGDISKFFPMSEYVPMIYPVEEAQRVNGIPNDLF